MNRHRHVVAGLKTRLTYANVVSTLALMVALGTGGAYAANQLGKNSVTSRVIRDHAVKPRDLSFKARGARANVSAAGRVGNGDATADFAAPNQYTVTFTRDVSACSYSATATGDFNSPDNATAAVVGKGGREVQVQTFDGAGTPAASSFSLVANC